MKPFHTITGKITFLLLIMTSLSLLLAGGVSVWSLHAMKSTSMESNRKLGEKAAEDAEKSLEDMAGEQLYTIAVEKAGYIEEKFSTVEAYVHGIAAQAQDIYENPEKYPDREVPLPVKGSTLLAPQLLWSKQLSPKQGDISGTVPSFTEEILKLGNIQDMLVQYNANNDMVSSAYIATKSGWLIQTDYIADSKYSGNLDVPDYYEAADRQWYQRAAAAEEGEIIYSDVIRDVHRGGNCIVCAEPVFSGEEMVAVAGIGSYLNTVNKAVLNTTIGESGYAFLIGEKGQIVVSPKIEGETAAFAEKTVDLRSSDNEALADITEKVLRGDSGLEKITLDGRKVYLAYAPLRSLNWGLITVMEEEEVIAPAMAGQQQILALGESVAQKQNEAIRKTFLLFALVLTFTAIVISLSGMILGRRITKPILRLTEDVGRIGSGNLDYRIQIETGDEVEKLGNAFNKMTVQIQEYVENLALITSEKERIRSEIQVASRLQADMLPKAEEMFKKRKDFSLAACMTPAKGVGGDFYDFFLLDEDRLALVIADVSGKGVPAALFMVVSRTVIKSRLQNLGKEQMTAEGMLAKAAKDINNILCADNRNEMFVTVWMGVLTLSTGRLEFVNAGHCLPLICFQSGVYEYETFLGGLVFAGMENVSYRQSEIRLHQGDTLLLYTDGVIEAVNAEKEMYGEERLKKAAEICRQQGTGNTPEELLKAIWQDVAGFQKGEEQFDDITMLAVTWYGQGVLEKKGKPDMENIWEFKSFIESSMKVRQISMQTSLKIQIAADEIFSNICYYSGATEVTLSIYIEENAKGKNVVLCFEDDGIYFDPLKRTEPDVDELLEKRKTGGLGIYLVKKQMDKVSYEYKAGRNRLTIYIQDIGQEEGQYE